MKNVSNLRVLMFLSFLILMNNKIFAQCTLSVVAKDIKTCYNTDVALQALVDGGSGNYTFKWKDSGALNDAALSDYLIAAPSTISIGLTSKYIVQVTDLTTTCVQTDTMFVIVKPLKADAGVEMEFCSNIDTVFVGSYTGGWGKPKDCKFKWSPLPEIFSQDSLRTKVGFANSNPTNFDYIINLTVTDSLGCTDMATKKVRIYPQIIFTGYADKTICLSGSAILSGSVTNGTGSINSSWIPNSTLVENTSTKATVTPLVTTDYYLTATDDLCSDAIKIVVAIDPKIITTLQTDTICANSATTLKHTHTGGTSTFSYLWSPANLLVNPAIAMPTTVKLSTSTKFFLSITDAIGCVKKDSMQIIINNPIVSLGDTLKVCNNTLSTLSPTVTGGSGRSSTFKYLWSPALGITKVNALSTTIKLANTSSSPTFSKYKMTVTDSISCTHSDSIIISINPALTFTNFTTKTICLYDSTNIGGTVGGGNGSAAKFTYKWSPAVTLSRTDTLKTIAKPTGSTTYKLIATDLMLCKDSTLQTVNLYPILRPEAGPNVTICFSASTQLNGSATGGTGTLIYSWSPSTNLNKSNIKNPVASNLVTQTKYYMEVTDALGCKATDDVTISTDLPEMDDIADVNACLTGTKKFTTLGRNGVPPYKYAWMVKSTPANPKSFHGLLQKDVTDSISNVTVVEGNPVGVYTYYVRVKDKLGCYSFVYMAKAIVHDAPVFVKNKLVKNCFETTYNKQIKADSGFAAYKWKFNSQTSRITNVSAAGYYVYTATDQFGCFANDSIKVVAVCPPRIFVPEAFSPNDDLLNEELRIFGDYYRDAYMKIYNRWGELIYFQNSETGPWKGTYKGVPVSPGLYVYEVYYKDLFSEEFHVKTGKVMVVK